MEGKVELVFEREKETKNTVRFQEVAKDRPPLIGSLYVAKWWAGAATTLKVVVEK